MQEIFGLDFNELESAGYWDEADPYLTNEQDRVVEFHFFSDKLFLRAAWLAPWMDDNCLVRVPFPLKRPVFPFTGKAGRELSAQESNHGDAPAQSRTQEI